MIQLPLPVRRGFLFASALAALALPARALSVRPPSFAELVAAADTIVQATVVAVEPRRVPDRGGRPVVKTFVRLRVAATLKGAPPAEIELSVLGGEADGARLRVPGLPEFRAGEAAFYFVAGNGRVFCPLVAVGHGRYPVVADADGGARVTRDNGEPLHDLAQVARPLDHPAAAARGVGFTPEQFADAVRVELRRAAAGREVVP